MDRYASGAGLLNPAIGGETVTPGTPFNETCRALYVGTGGDVAVVLLDGSELTFVGVTAGCVLPVRASEVPVLGTTASGILALY